MNKIALIIQREYLSRVRKRSFIVMTIIGPLLFAAFIILPAWLSQVEDTGEKIIAVLETNEYNEPKPDSLRFFDVIPDKALGEARQAEAEILRGHHRGPLPPH